MNSILVCVGIAMIGAGLLILIYEKTPGNNELSIFGASFKLSHPSLVVIALGFVLILKGATDTSAIIPPLKDVVPSIRPPVVDPSAAKAEPTSADARRADLTPSPQPPAADAASPTMPSPVDAAADAAAPPSPPAADAADAAAPVRPAAADAASKAASQ